jgi:hypothetical protein
MTWDNAVTDDDPEAEYRRGVVRDLAIAASIFAGVASALVMFLIAKKGDRNTHVTLIFWMTTFQFFYDATFVPSAAHGGDRDTYLFGQFCQNTFGLLSSFITNVIAGILYYVIVMRKAFDLHAYWVQVSLLTYLPVLLIQVATIWAFVTDPEKNLRTVNIIYYWLRVISIVLNFLLCSMAYYKHVGTMADSSFRTYTDGLLRTLIKRTLWYPIVQVITRLPACYYEYRYGWKPYVGDGGADKFAEAVLWVLFTPAAGLGYLAIYLISAPGAKQNMHKLFCIDFPALFMCKRGCDVLLEPWDRSMRETREEGLNKVRQFNAKLKKQSDTLSGAGSDRDRAGTIDTYESQNSSFAATRYNDDLGNRNSRQLSAFSEGNEEESVGSRDNTAKPSTITASSGGDEIPDSMSIISREGSRRSDGFEKSMLRHMEELEEDELFEVMGNLENLDDLQKKGAGGTQHNPIVPAAESGRERKRTAGSSTSGPSGKGSSFGSGGPVTSFSMSSDDDQDHSEV